MAVLECPVEMWWGQIAERAGGGGAGEGRTKQWGTKTLGDLWQGEGWGWGTWGIQDEHCRDFQEGKLGICRRWAWVDYRG